MPTITATALHATKNDLSREAREVVVALLQERLASAIDIQLQAKQAHWNVKGPSFIALHELFDAVVAEATAEPLQKRQRRRQRQSEQGRGGQRQRPAVSLPRTPTVTRVRTSPTRRTC